MNRGKRETKERQKEKGMTTRNEQKEQTRQRILWAGLSLFVQKGYAATKISDIAQAVQISAGLMFHYFESKEALYEELIRTGVEGTKISLGIPYDEPLEYFRNLLSMLLKYTREQPWVANMFVLVETTQRSEAAPAHIRELANQVNQIPFSAQLIKQGQKAGAIREGDPMSLSYAFWSSIQGVMEQLSVNPEIPLPDAEWILAIIKKP